MLAGTLVVSAGGLDAAVQAKIDARLKIIQSWASDPVLVKAVQAHNSGVPTDYSAMTQDKWKSLTILDPFVRGFTRNETAAFLKGRKTEVISEAFMSGADGLKVAFLAKTTNWSHKGKPKHDVPMTGRTWQGPVEVDESTGLEQIQVAVPVLDGDKPIGSLVVGLSLANLTRE